MRQPPQSRKYSGKTPKIRPKNVIFPGKQGGSPPSLENIRAKRQKFGQKKRNFFGQTGRRPPKSDRARTPMASGLANSTYHSWETAFPLLLHEKMQFTKELMEYTHCKSLVHLGGLGTLLNQLRKKYHVVGGKKGATKVKQRCFPCAKEPWTPITQRLPEFHGIWLGNKGLRAFSEIGIDHAGPSQLRQGRSSVEGYILAIACCATQAVNLEMSMSTGADHDFSALQRHVGVFGAPTYINSDLGTGFVKARSLMKEKGQHV